MTKEEAIKTLFNETQFNESLIETNYEEKLQELKKACAVLEGQSYPSLDPTIKDGSSDIETIEEEIDDPETNKPKVFDTLSTWYVWFPLVLLLTTTIAGVVFWNKKRTAYNTLELEGEKNNTKAGLLVNKEFKLKNIGKDTLTLRSLIAFYYDEKTSSIKRYENLRLDTLKGVDLTYEPLKEDRKKLEIMGTNDIEYNGSVLMFQIITVNNSGELTATTKYVGNRETDVIPIP